MDCENITVADLADYPAFIPTCATWAYEQWGKQVHGDFDRTVKAFTGRAQKDAIPFTLIALDGDKIVGMASMVECDLESRPDLTPWLASVYVRGDYRKNHIASRLVQKVEKKAAKLGIKRAFLRTEDAQLLYEILGWEVTDRAKTALGDAVIMAKDVPCADSDC